MMTSDCYDGFCTAVYSCGVPHNALVLLEKRQLFVIVYVSKDCLHRVHNTPKWCKPRV